MDTKAPKNLDPKLKEVYERVMGTKVPSAPSNISTTQPINQPQAPIQQLKPDIPVAPLASSIPSTPSIPSKQPIASPPTPPSPQAFVAGNNNKKSKGPLTIALFIILGIIFFLVYMIFWIKLFGVHLSFLPF